MDLDKNLLNPYVNISKEDKESAEKFIKKSTSILHPTRTRSLKKCLICKKLHQLVLDSPKDRNTTIISVEIYRKLIVLLHDLNLNSANLQKTDDGNLNNLQVCCSSCKEACDRIWECHRQQKEIEAEISDLSERIKKAVKLKRPVALPSPNPKSFSISSSHFETNEEEENEKTQNSKSKQTEINDGLASSAISSVIWGQTKTAFPYSRASRRQSDAVSVTEMGPVFIDEDDDVFESFPCEDLDDLPSDKPKPSCSKNPMVAAPPDPDKDSNATKEETSVLSSSRHNKTKAIERIHQIVSGLLFEDELTSNSKGRQSQNLSGDAVLKHETLNEGNEDEDMDPTFSVEVNSNKSSDEEQENEDLKEEKRLFTSKSSGETRKLNLSKKTHPGRRLSCDICRKSLAHAVALRRHKRVVHYQMKNYPCMEPGCNFKSFSNHSLKRHLGSHAGVKPVQCDKCGKRLTSIYMLKLHEKKGKNCASRIAKAKANAESKSDQNSSQTDASKEVTERTVDRTRIKEKPKQIFKRRPELKCETCGETLKTQTSLMRHMSEVHNEEKAFRCSKCGKRFGSSNQLKRHQRYVLCIELDEAAKLEFLEKNKVICDICGNTFATAQILSSHKWRQHKSENQYKCSICPKSFILKRSLDAHEKKHQETDSSLLNTSSRTVIVSCEICGLSLQRGSLPHHLRKVHLGVKNHKCTEPDCSFAAYDKNGLTRHLASHRGEKPVLTRMQKIPCEICGVVLRERHLTGHKKRVHDKVQNFQCPKCDKGFFMKYDLVKHLRSHDGIKMFQCVKCGKQFTNKTSMNKHERKNLCKWNKDKHGDANASKKRKIRKNKSSGGFACDHCSVVLKSENGLNKHLVKKHPDLYEEEEEVDSEEEMEVEVETMEVYDDNLV